MNTIFRQTMQVPECVQKFCDMPDTFVFKKCREYRGFQEFLVVLEKPSCGFICNESREAVVKKDYAKFRCNGLIPRLIVSLGKYNKERDDLDHYTEISCEFTTYELGRLVTPSRFDDRLHIVCAAGIHYFLTPLAAMAYDIDDGVVEFGTTRYAHDGSVICSSRCK